MIKKCKILRVHLESSTRQISRVRCQFRMFLTWILQAKRKFNGGQENEDVTATDILLDVDQLVDFVQGPMRENFFDRILERCDFEDCRRALEIMELEKQEEEDEPLTYNLDLEPQGLSYQIERLMQGMTFVRRVIACYFDEKIKVVRALNINPSMDGTCLPIKQFRVAPHEFDQSRQWFGVRVQGFVFSRNIQEALVLIGISQVKFQDQNVNDMQNSNSNEILKKVMQSLNFPTASQTMNYQQNYSSYDVQIYTLGIEQGLHLSDFACYKDNEVLVVVHRTQNEGYNSDDFQSSFIMKGSVDLNSQQYGIINERIIQQMPHWLMRASCQNFLATDEVEQIQIWPFHCSSQNARCEVNSDRGLVFLVSDKSRVMVMELDGDDEMEDYEEDEDEENHPDDEDYMQT
eukprot:TRINITY_DN1785_c0_g2_i1.p1 TRINITY_DN1785_c0_g2~~TRINITY_DN1785_c0_g2_i1.p1  ORF type:complete len:457 (-),score=41.31 TRINITY_DN1785_c0_g2_i1:235-1446(-)